MAIINPETLTSSSNLTLWFKVYSGDSLSLADVPEIVPLRWTYIRDTWPTLRVKLENQAPGNFDPDYFRSVLDDFDTFIAQRRYDKVANNPLSGSDTFFRFYPIFDAMRVEQISLSNEEADLLDKKKKSVSSFSKNDFLKIKRDITAYRDYITDTIGLSDDDYNEIYGRSSVPAQVEANITDLNLLKVLQDQLASVNFILANLFAIDAAIDPFALARQNANNPEVDIGQYSSGFLVKLHFGEDLSGLANRYFGNPDKWIDIAIANGLKEPYVDEVGETLYFTANGRGNQINLRATDSNNLPNRNKFYINQPVQLQSTSIPFPEQRQVINIKEIPVSGEIILTLSGDANLDLYLLDDQANIRIFKPNTVNSSLFVLIPTPTPLDNTREDEIPWFQQGSAADEKKAKIDLAVDDAGSLTFTTTGDIGLSYGLANAIQAVKLKLLTELGSNRYHPEYGLVNLVGSANLDETAAKSTLTDSITSQIRADERFDRVESLTVNRKDTVAGVAYTIDLTVRLADSNTLIPISFTVAT